MQARFEIPLALVHDRFILALGGKTNKTNGTRRCEAFDTVCNHWFQIETLPVTCVRATAVVLNDQEVYLMPGNNKETQTGTSLVICHLNTGPTS